MINPMESTFLPVTALVLSISMQPLHAAKKAPITPSGKETPAAEAPHDTRAQKKLKRAHHLTEKAASSEFGRSPEGIALKNLIAAANQEINAVDEKHLNIWRESPATQKGKELRAERDQQIRLLEQKVSKAEADFETLRASSPAYRDMLAAHLKSELKSANEKLRNQQSEEPGEEENPEDDEESK